MKKTVLGATILFVVMAAAACFGIAESAVPTLTDLCQSIDAGRMQDVVTELASEKYRGREPGTKGDELAQAYIAGQFQAAGLVAYAGQGYLQAFSFTDEEGEEISTANVVGIIPGSNPELSKEIIVIGCHFDHIGLEDEDVNPGANDNASGVSAVVELAYAFGKYQGQFGRTLIFAAFGAEEEGMFGSRHFVDTFAENNPEAEIMFMLNFDMIGRNNEFIANLSDTEKADLVERWFAQAYQKLPAKKTADGLSFVSYDSGKDEVDAGIFGEAGIQNRTFWLEDEFYHSPEDVASSINYQGAAEVVNLGAAFLLKLAN